MTQLNAIVSESPEELPEAFFKEWKKFSGDQRVRVWSRKSQLPMDYDMYFLSARDFVYLNKHKHLPPGHKVCVLATASDLDLSFIESEYSKISGYIIGSEVARGTLAATFFAHICDAWQGLLPRETELSHNLHHITSLVAPEWFKHKIRHALDEISSLEEGRNCSFRITDETGLVRMTVECQTSFPSLELFSYCFTSTSSESFTEDALKLVVLKSLLNSVSQTIIYRGKEGVTYFDLAFEKTKTQRKYELSPKLFGLNHIKAKHV